MYPEYKGLDLTAIDKSISEYWENNQIFKKSIDHRDPKNSFVFYEGPPSANGLPGIHHVMARTIKDLFCRYQSMLGHRVERKGGWDTHGLPVELAVEKELGITKEDIGKKITVEEYNAKCREAVMRFKGQWDDLTEKMGYWVDLDAPYITFENNYIESVWNLLSKLYNKGLLYKGYTIQPYSPAAGTGLSSHELNMPGTYKDVKDTSVVAQFRILPGDQADFILQQEEDWGDAFFLAWTTTPWTLPSNTALSVGSGINYVLVKTYNPYTHVPVRVILAKSLLSKWFKEEFRDDPFEEYTQDAKKLPWTILSEFEGTDLDGIRYEQLLPYTTPEDGDAFVVVTGNHVTTEDGTGIVHTAPSFGADDMLMAKKHGLGSLTLVDKEGKFKSEVTDFAGMHVKDYQDQGDDFVNPDIEIAIKLKKENRAFNVQKYNHNYPHCWRTDKPILYYPLDSWFVKTTACKEQMVELNKTINWKPSHTGEKRFGNWLENLQDWNLSRSRFWGIPLPIWRSESGAEKCIGSIQELSTEIKKANERLGLNQDVPEDLHRPYIDDVVLVDDLTGQKMVRETDLIDVWFDSGSMPYAQWHYPFENQEVFENNYPADFIAEGVDQTRGWFFTLHAISVMVNDQVAFKNVVSNGLVQDKDGRKMSKRLGNAVDPFETLGTYGADATRWYMISNAQAWDNLKFDISGIEEVRRKFFGTLYNTYSFLALYANIDDFSYSEEDIENRPEIDNWILSELQTLIRKVGECYSDYEATNATRLIQGFVDDKLSNWYVRLCRRRFWKGSYSDDKISAYQTLYTCLIELSKLMAPVAPFFADWLYQNLNNTTHKEAHESVHLANFPLVKEELIDDELQKRMSYAQRITSLVLSLRKRDNLRVRQPLQKIMMPVLDPSIQAAVEQIQELVLSEVNVKELQFVEDSAGIIKKKIKPNFPLLGKKLGKKMKALSQQVNSWGQEEIAQLEKNKTIELEIEGESMSFVRDEFIITSEDLEGWIVASDQELTVALDINLTPELRAEGNARELVNRIQNLRKDKDFEVTDKIKVTLSPAPEVSQAVESFGEYISNEVLAADLIVAENDGTEIELPEAQKVRIDLQKL